MRRWWLRVTAGAVVLVAVGAWSLALQVGSGSGEAFALAVPPSTLPASWMPAATEVTTATAVDTSVAIAGAEGAGAAAAGTVCAATVACAVVAVGVLGAAYGTYKLLHWAWGSHHVAQTAPTGLDVSNICRTDSPYGTFCAGMRIASQNADGTYEVHVEETTQYASWNHLYFSAGQMECQTVSWPGGQTFTDTGAGQWVAGPANVTTFDGHECHANSDYVNGAPTQIEVGVGNGDGGPSLGQTLYVCVTTATGAFGCAGDSHTVNQAVQSLPKHDVRVHTECIGTEVTQATPPSSSSYSTYDPATGAHGVYWVDSVSPQFDDSSSSIPDTSASPCPQGTIPGSSQVTEETPGQNPTPLYQVPDPKLDPANPCSAVGSGCVPTLQRVTTSGLWVDDLNDYPSVTMDGSYRCEEEGPATVSPRLDGGQLPMSDCVAAQPSPNPSPSATPSPAPSVLDPYVPQAPPTSDGRSCFPHGIGLFNPIEWVYKPTVCALRWAFVPDSTAVQADVSTLTDTWDATPPGVVVTSAHKLIDPFTNAAPSGSADCAGPLVSFSIPSPFSSHPDNYSVAIHPFSMCNQIGAWVHDYFYPLMTLVLYLATFWQVARTLTSTIGLDTPFDEDGGGMASPL